jgi:hypothetical protein
MTDLLPCPFCGKQPLIVCPNDSYGSSLITCGDGNECPADLTVWGEPDDIEGTARIWNTRALTRQAQVSDNAVTPAMIDAALDAWDSSEGDDRGRMWNAIERAMQAFATNSEAVSELDQLREELRVYMLEQPLSGERNTYSDGFANGLCEAIRRMDKLGSRAP